MKSQLIFSTIFFLTIFVNNIFGQINGSNQEYIISEDIKLIQLKDSVFMHISADYDKEYGRFTSNGIVFIRNGKALIIDTPMDTNKTKDLIEYLSGSMNVQTELFIAGHFHADCVGGIDFIKRNNIRSITGCLTSALSEEHHISKADTCFNDSLIINFHGSTIECFYPGAAHTKDNIVIWFDAEKILFGGCMIKSMKSNTPGNLSDADTASWENSLTNVSKRYVNAEIVVPGHGSPGTKELFEHTIKIIQNLAIDKN